LQQRPVKILLVASDREYLDDLCERLSVVRGGELDIEWAGEVSEALARLTQGGIDAILLDLDLPDSTGMVTFERAYAFAPDVPIIVLTNEADEKVANATVQGGAQDYMVRVDDDEDARLLMRTLLERDGYDVSEVEDGHKALDLLKDDQEFDLAMPGLNGRAVLQQVRDSVETAVLPVLIRTGTGSDEIEAELLEAGADDYVEKSVDADRFLARVHAVLRRAM
jgi:DNA-binding response OmpR family regulator